MGETEIKKTRKGMEGRIYSGKNKIEKTRKVMEGRRYSEIQWERLR